MAFGRFRRGHGEFRYLIGVYTHVSAERLQRKEREIDELKQSLMRLQTELVEAHLRHHVLAQAEQVNEEELAEFLKLLKRYG